MNLQPLSIGIDGGGTHTRARSSDQTEILGPASNVATLGVEASAGVLAEMIGRIVPDDGYSLCIAAGVAGAADQDVREDLSRALLRYLSPRAIQVEILTDAELALDAAYGLNEPGMVAITGTGSIVFARDVEGYLHRAGGWGPAIGDEGGGYRLGSAGLSAVADAFDGGPGTILAKLARDRWHVADAESLRRMVYRERRSPASFAPCVLDACEGGDQVALAILSLQVMALANRVVWLASHLPVSPGELTIFGGLSSREVFLIALKSAIAEHLPDFELVRTTTAPVEAALARASTMG